MIWLRVNGGFETGTLFWWVASCFLDLVLVTMFPPAPILLDLEFSVAVLKESNKEFTQQKKRENSDDLH